MARADEHLDVQDFGDSVRLRHSRHFDVCATTGQWSGLFFDYLYRDLEPHLLGALRELETRANRTLRDARRQAVLSALYERQDKEPDRLVTLFLSCCAPDGPEGLGFGHRGDGRMGITDAACFARNLTRFSDAIWAEVLVLATSG
jgi:hypothetical protein